MRTRKKKTNKSNKKAEAASNGETGGAFFDRHGEGIIGLMAFS